MQCLRPLRAWTYAQALAGHGKPTQLARKTARTLTLPSRPQEMQLRWNPGAIAVELELCGALGGWAPWSAPSAEVLQAMANVQRYRESAGKELADLPLMCTRRAEAITELAYEEAHFAQMPPTLRYQKLAQIRCWRWHQVVPPRQVHT